MIGYKYLNLSETNLHLFSPIVFHAWSPGWNKMEGMMWEVTVPWQISGYGPGFYSMKEPMGYDSAVSYVVKLELAGKVVEHEFGYRSEYARIVKIVTVVNEYYSKFVETVERLYKLEPSGLGKDNWQQVTPNTKIYQAYPDNSDRYYIPYLAPAPFFHQPTELVHYQQVEIIFDKKKVVGNRQFRYGYNSQLDILVYKEVV
jgi:hypothetical protein